MVETVGQQPFHILHSELTNLIFSSFISLQMTSAELRQNDDFLAWLFISRLLVVGRELLLLDFVYNIIYNLKMSISILLS